MAHIIDNASQYRKDIDPTAFAMCDLFRGSGMTEDHIEEYRQLAREYGNMRLFGLTSTSRDRSAAEKFAYSNENTQIKRVLFHIKWHDH